MKKPKSLQKAKKPKKRIHRHKSKYKWYQRRNPISNAVENAVYDAVYPKKRKLRRYEKRKKGKYGLEIDDSDIVRRRRISGYKDHQDDKTSRRFNPVYWILTVVVIIISLIVMWIGQYF